jgi:hypothetical protein
MLRFSYRIPRLLIADSCAAKETWWSQKPMAIRTGNIGKAIGSMGKVAQENE